MRNRLIGLLIVSVGLLVVYNATRKPVEEPVVVKYERPWFQNTGASKQYDISCYTNTCEVFFSSSIEEMSNYISLAKLLETAPKDSVINLHLAGNGGSTDTVLYLGNAVKLSKATVNTIVDGPVYSAHAYLALLGDKITLGPNVFLMFHSPAVAVKGPSGNYFYISLDEMCKLVDEKDLDRGKSSRQKCVVGNTFYKQAITKYLTDFGRGYISEEEMKNIVDGDDVYIAGSVMQERVTK